MDNDFDYNQMDIDEIVKKLRENESLKDSKWADLIEYLLCLELEEK